MKILFSIFFIIISNLPFYAQNKNLPKECEKILKENFPSFRYDIDWDYENVRNSSAAYSANFNGEAKSDD